MEHDRLFACLAEVQQMQRGIERNARDKEQRRDGYDSDSHISFTRQRMSLVYPWILEAGTSLLFASREGAKDVNIRERQHYGGKGDMSVKVDQCVRLLR